MDRTEIKRGGQKAMLKYLSVSKMTEKDLERIVFLRHNEFKYGITLSNMQVGRQNKIGQIDMRPRTGINKREIKLNS